VIWFLTLKVFLHKRWIKFSLKVMLSFNPNKTVAFRNYSYVNRPSYCIKKWVNPFMDLSRTNKGLCDDS
jgi:hypothetical protein